MFFALHANRISKVGFQLRITFHAMKRHNAIKSTFNKTLASQQTDVTGSCDHVCKMYDFIGWQNCICVCLAENGWEMMRNFGILHDPSISFHHSKMVTKVNFHEFSHIFAPNNLNQFDMDYLLLFHQRGYSGMSGYVWYCLVFCCCVICREGAGRQSTISCISNASVTIVDAFSIIFWYFLGFWILGKGYDPRWSKSIQDHLSLVTWSCHESEINLFSHHADPCISMLHGCYGLMLVFLQYFVNFCVTSMVVIFAVFCKLLCNMHDCMLYHVIARYCASLMFCWMMPNACAIMCCCLCVIVCAWFCNVLPDFASTMLTYADII